MASASAASEGRRISAAGDPLELGVPTCESGIGAVISQPDAEGLIAGVSVEPYPLWPDDRGWFVEVARLGQGAIAGFDPGASQVSAALTYPGAIKAFHYHLHQTDYWQVVAGMLQVALVDLREDSATFGGKNTFYIGALRPWRLVIPPGVAHGYKVIGEAPGVLVYLTDRQYNPADEGRIPHDDPGIAYDWDLQHK